MKKYRFLCYGISIGICFEYLYRVQFLIYPLVVLIALIGAIILESVLKYRE